MATAAGIAIQESGLSAPDAVDESREKLAVFNQLDNEKCYRSKPLK
jgi:hypothetical protein